MTIGVGEVWEAEKAAQAKAFDAAQIGVRLEDHFYMAADGPVWFTQPSPSIDDPFGA